MTDRLIRTTTAAAVALVAAIAAVISYRHAYHLVHAHGETGPTARLVPLTVDGLIWAASMVILDARRRAQPIPTLAAWSLGMGIAATIGANLAHGLEHGPIGALIGAWPALALVGSYELLMVLLRTTPPPAASSTHHQTPSSQPETPSIRTTSDQATAGPQPHAPADVEEAVLADYRASLESPGPPASQRYLARKHGIDRRRVKQIITGGPSP